MNRGKIRRRIPSKPFGMLSGLLAGCLTTMIGVASGFDPFTILSRAFVSGLVVGLTVAFGVSVIRLANIPNETKVN